MKVLLQHPSNAGSWLTPGTLYAVLAIEYQGGRPMYRIAAENGTPALFDAALFSVADASVAPGWTVRHGENGSTELLPEDWDMPGFWEKFFEGDEDAVSRYEDALLRMQGT